MNNLKQTGFALVTSMLLLLVMVMLGVSMFGGVNLQEKVSENTRIKNRTMLAADSSIQRKWTLSVLRKKMLSKPKTDDVGTSYSTSDKKILLNGEVSICYLGEDSYSPGNSVDATLAHNKTMTWKQQKFFAASHVEEVATSSATTIEQGGYMLLPSMDRDPNCNLKILESVCKECAEEFKKTL